jgi:endonuclease/exonuclease/phosphatase (EEP) superfamily protein YafD
MSQSALPAKKRNLTRSALTAMLALFLLPAIAFSGLNLVAPDTWIADTFVHFRIQYLLIGVLVLMLTVWHRNKWLAIAAVATVVLNAGQVMTYFAMPAIGQAHAKPTATDNFETYRIASANIYARNDSFDLVADWITREDPDFVVLLEAGYRWKSEMQQRLSQYPHQRLTLRYRGLGKLVISKLPFEKFDTLESVGGRTETPLVTLRRNNAPVRIIGLHTNWPIKYEGAMSRNIELDRVARVAQEQATPLVALGDYNVTPFSKHFQKMERDGSLRRASAGRGWLHSWPTFFMPAGIQIDHIMITPSIQVLGYKTGAGLNSDHKWVMADLLVPKQKP